MYVGGGVEFDKVIVEINFNIVVIWIDLLDKFLVEWCYKKGLKVFVLVLGIDDVEEFDWKVIEFGVDVLVMDRLELFVKKYRLEYIWIK